MDPRTPAPKPNTRRPASALLAGACVSILVCLPSCMMRVQRSSLAAFTYDTTRAARPERTDTELPWPHRWGDETGARGVIVPLEGPLSVWDSVWLGEHHAWRSREVEYADAAALGEAFGEPAGFKFRTEGPGSFLFVRDGRFSEPDPPPVPEPTAADPAEMFKYVSATVTRTWESVPGVELQRTWFALYDPYGIDADDSRGTIVLLPGMFGTPEPVIESVIKSQRARGWSVLRMMSHPSRFTERLEVPVDADDPTEAAEIFASHLTDRAAECAFATEAAVDHARTLRPDLDDKPVVLLGMSGGAIALPTVHALRPDLYDGAILVAGGVNFLGINLESNYASFIDAIHAQWGPEGGDPVPPTPDQRDALVQAYTERAHLDGYYLAERLTDKPTLIIHGSSDRAVPAHLGEQLWERAGRPERWTFPVGHELVFLALPTQTGRMDRWIAEHIEGVSAEPEHADHELTQ